MRVTVQHGGKALTIDVQDDAKVATLQERIQEETRVLARHQKLIYKGQVLPPEDLMTQHKMKEGCKVMLLSTVGIQTQGQTIAAQQLKERAASARAAHAANIQKQLKCRESRRPEAQASDVQARRVASWQKLQVASLLDQQRSTLPEELLAQVALRTAELSGNLLHALPEGFSALSALRDLRLSRNRLGPGEAAVLPLQGLRHLTTLLLDHNLCALEDFLASIAMLEEYPQSLCQLPSLQTCSLANNCLTTLPENIGSLANLQMLDISHNCISALPESLGSCQQLCDLRAASNVLTSLVESISTLKKLRCLLLDDNRINGVPPAILTGCESLFTLSLHKNPVTVEQLRTTPGFEAFDERRRAKYSKQMSQGVMAPADGFDEGADAVQWQSWGR